MILAFGVLLYAPINPAYAGTTTADFLKWERKAQDSFFRIAITMAATMTAQAQPEMAICIDSWYFKTEALQKNRHSEIIEQMPQLATYRPTSVVLAFLEAACGKLK